MDYKANSWFEDRHCGEFQPSLYIGPTDVDCKAKSRFEDRHCSDVVSSSHHCA